MSHYDCPCMEKCPLHYAMSLIGGKWKVQILCSVTNAGTIRYNALRGKLDGISNTVLASALRGREELFARLGKDMPDARILDVFRLPTDYHNLKVLVKSRGEDCRRLLPILEQLSDWAEARMPADESTTKKEEPQ